MGKLKLTIHLITLIFCGAGFIAARPAQQPQAGKCAIAGRVVVGETPVRGAVVIATFEDPDPSRRFMSTPGLSLTLPAWTPTIVS